MSRELVSVEKLYGEQNLAKWRLFCGEYINFGYWMPREGAVTQNDRKKSSKRLYQEVFDRLDINEYDRLLEVGCGLGKGARLAYETYFPLEVVAIDASEDQVSRAQAINSEVAAGKLTFLSAEAEKLSSLGKKFSKLYSVEALQHFDDVPKFIGEAYASLLQGGKVVITTFFFKKHPDPQYLKDAFPNVISGVDKVVLVDEFIAQLEAAGFVNVCCESIGEHVWEGFDKWMASTEFSGTWNRNWLKAYQNKLLDYYMITAEKPSLRERA